MSFSLKFNPSMAFCLFLFSEGLTETYPSFALLSSVAR